MESSEEDNDEEVELRHWNNWSEPGNALPFTRSFERKIIHGYVFNKPQLFNCSSLITKPSFRNWIPPANFILSKGSKSYLVSEKNESELSQIDVPKKDESTVRYKWKVNEDWGEQVELNDVTKFKDGDLIWGVINVGIFGCIKLWVNSYDNICVLAEGTISKLGSTEATLISVVKAELLRKMLCLSLAQWASLCEEVLESKASLNFDAFIDSDLGNKSSLDKMWFFICKRRHLLQEQCMLVKLSGAVKCLKKFEIFPKLVVQDIRNLKGEPIL